MQRKFEKQVLGGAHCADLQASEACLETGQLCSLAGVATTCSTITRCSSRSRRSSVRTLGGADSL